VTLNGNGTVDAIIEAIASAPEAADVPMSISDLAALPPFEYAKVRIAQAKHHGVNVRALDLEVDSQRKKNSPKVDHIECAAEAVDGLKLLSDLIGFFDRYLVLPLHAALVLALWVIHTYLLEIFDHTPRLVILSPESECGKSTVLDLLAVVVRRPHQTEGLTAAAMFRCIADGRDSFLIDEADTFLPKNEEMRGIIDSGFRRKGSVDRCVGDDHKSTPFSTFAPVALASLKRLEDTIMRRGIELQMRRKLSSESRPITLDAKLEREGKPLAMRCARWAKDYAVAISAAIEAQAAADRPEELTFYQGLQGLKGRQIDKWRALLCIADEIGAAWGVAARDAAVALSASHSTGSGWKTLLLRDLRTLFNATGATQLSSKFICAHLASLEERPWAKFGKENPAPIDASGLRGMLNGYQIKPTPIRLNYQADIDLVETETSRGYYAAQFNDAFERYLSDTPAAAPGDEPPNAVAPVSEAAKPNEDFLDL
jgi:hypothetical protein